jgi:predicted nucleotidyltransferase
MITDGDRRTIEETAAKYGVKRVVLFGSSLSPDEESFDIAIGVDGLDDEVFFAFYGELLFLLSKPVDVVDISRKSRFTEMVEQEGLLLYA